MSMRPRTSLRRALADERLLGATLRGDSWKPWRTLLIAAMGEALDDDERAIFRELTGREREPGQRIEEGAWCIGRRGGKSRAVSVAATYLSALNEHPNLVPGERGLLLIIAPDQRQSAICLDYIEAAFRGSAVLRQLVESRTATQLRLSNGIDIEVRASDFRRLRGPTYVAVICDESAFYFNAEDSANADAEILNAVRPGLATTGGPLFMISSPYARRGELWRLFQKHYGADGDPRILVARAPSRTMNSTLPQSVVDRAYERDPASAAAEYGAAFRRDIESWCSIEAVNACVAKGTYERRRQHSHSAFVDPSGGSVDSMTLAVGHCDHGKQTVVLDALREAVPPFSPEAVVELFAKTLGDYGLDHVVGDRYGGLWPVEQFSKFGIRYEQSAAPKSDLYRDLLPLLNSGRIELLDHPRLIAQLTALERHVSRGGRDSIDHPPGARDDLANCVAGLAAINNKFGGFDSSFSFIDQDDGDDPHGIASWRRNRLAAYLNSHGLVRL
jgi:hypothetical protein